MALHSVLKSKDQILDTLRNIQKDVDQSKSQNTNSQSSGSSFYEHLKESTKEINKAQVVADVKSVELNTGRNGNIHETMLAATQAELSLNLMVQIRNKALEAYNEIMRMPV